MKANNTDFESLDAALEREGKLHAEVEYYIDTIAYKKSVSLTAGYIDRLYNRAMLDKISQNRILKLPEIKNNEDLNSLKPEEISELLLNRKLNKIVDSGELVGGLVQETGSYEEVRKFLRASKLFQTISDRYKEQGGVLYDQD